MSDAESRFVSVRVWDLPTRVCHWLLALAIVGSVLSAKAGGNAMAWHFRFGYVVFALLGFLALQVAAGRVGDDEIASAGPLNRFVSSALARRATHWHKDFGQWILLSLLALHVAAIVYYHWRKRTNLVRAMIVGDRRLPPGMPPSVDSLATRLFALLLLALCAVGVTWVVRLGGIDWRR
jgi:cytochrome b